MRALSATPATPSALPRRAAIVPATCVPWLSPSAGVVELRVAPDRRSSSRGRRRRSRCRRRRCRCPGSRRGWSRGARRGPGGVVSTPVSMTATVTGAAPAARVPARGRADRRQRPLLARSSGSFGHLERAAPAVEVHGVGRRRAGEQVARLGQRHRGGQLVGPPAGHERRATRRRRGRGRRRRAPRGPASGSTRTSTESLGSAATAVVAAAPSARTVRAHAAAACAAAASGQARAP